MTSKELREKRVALNEQAKELLKRASDENRDLSAEEIVQFDAIHADIDKMKEQIDRIERQEQLDLELRASQGTIAGHKALEGAVDPETGLPLTTRSKEEDLNKESEECRTAFRSWLVNGMAGITPEQRAIMAKRQSALPQEARAMAAGIDTSGGYIVFDEFAARIEAAMKMFSGIRNTRATVLRTNSGVQMNMPTSDDTSNSGMLVGENTDVGAAADITLGSKALNSYMFTSKALRVSIQFLQDTSIANTEGWIADRLAERIARGLAPYLISGTGNNQPEGLAVAGTLGATGASQTAVTWDDFVELEHSVDASYRRQAEYLIGDGLLKAAKKLKDGEGRPLWVPGVAIKAPDTINGYPYQVDMEIPTPAAGAITMYFGDFSKFIIRDVLSMQMLRLVERYAEFLQIAFLLFSRHDSVLLDAGTKPIRHFRQAG